MSKLLLLNNNDMEASTKSVIAQKLSWHHSQISTGISLQIIIILPLMLSVRLESITTSYLTRAKTSHFLNISEL